MPAMNDMPVVNGIPVANDMPVANNMPAANNYAVIDLLTNSAITGALTSGIGCFFAPASAAAAGGTLNVMVAYGLGAAITTIPSSLGLVAASSAFFIGMATNNYAMMGLGAVIAAVDIATTIYCAAAIGASIIGVAVSPVLTCALVGIAATALTGLLLTATAGLVVGAGVVGMINAYTPNVFNP